MLSLAAVGTTLLMARFLVRLRAVALEDGHHRHEAGAMIWMPWLVLLAASLGVVWLAVPELTGSVIAAGFKKSLLWKLCGPVAAGVILALAVAGLRRQARPWVEWPAGDVVYLPLKVLAVAQIAVTALVQRLHTGCCLVQQSQHRVAKFLIEHSSFLSRVEARLADFALLGLALLLVAGVAAWML
jgi:hypothetical protein